MFTMKYMKNMKVKPIKIVIHHEVHEEDRKMQMRVYK